ncbi:hypothetical protein LIER_13447 [Lithospermum erythrorhizon]|uniref:Calmodulin-binding domain-containing protein n=1 Tax=Lithospermum erythrorhizon TaxID=34254 RepID=A0AAV3PVL0_LITER
MVQRMVPNKLGIQADYVKPEKALSGNLKPPSFQHQDIKKRGADLKKTMKKSGSFKRQETERLHSSSMKRQIKQSQPGKPPPEDNPGTPRKPSPIKGVMDTTPNYMKSTTSSDARKERGVQVSSRSPKTSSDCKISVRRNSLSSNRKPSTNSANKPVVRNLTKVPSFKPIRTSAKKCSQMILCENLKVQRATCSSTIKDHKFPAYLTLSPGANEATGTSNIKVCPYTYCSLNGHHHHHALPPLKSFMLAKRRILKAQRNIKLGCLSPRRKKPIQNTMEEAEVQQWDSHENPPSGNSSLNQEEHEEYFIEIFSKEKKDQDIADCPVSDTKVSVYVQDEFATDNREDKQSSLGDQLDSFLEKNRNIGVGQKLYTPKTQGKIELDFLDFLYEMEVESAPSVQSEDTDTENYYVDRDAGVYIGGSHPGGRKFIKINDTIDLERANSPLDNALFLDGASEVYDESFTSEIMQELIHTENAYEAWSGDDDSEFISSHENIYDDQNHSTIGTDESDDHLDDMFTADSARLKIDEHGIRMMNEAQSNDAFFQKMNPETEDCHDKGSQAFDGPHAFSENPMEKLTTSIGTQTENECEYQHDMSWKLAEVHKRSIGTQTDFEDELKENTCFQMDQLASGNMNEKEGKHSIDGIENITLLQNSDEDANQTVAGGNDNGNLSFADENNANESGLNKVVAESAHPQEASGTENREKHVGDCSPEEIVKLNRIIKGNKSVISQNEEQIEFNPRAPNFLPVEPGQDAEKVDLRHLTMDEKRNADEWMVDYALQQALTKLAPARKREVALLVKAFETVTPIPNESRERLSSTASVKGKTVLA